jgi:hypothetical protein
VLKRKIPKLRKMFETIGDEINGNISLLIMEILCHLYRSSVVRIVISFRSSDHGLGILLESGQLEDREKEVTYAVRWKKVSEGSA